MQLSSESSVSPHLKMCTAADMLRAIENHGSHPPMPCVKQIRKKHARQFDFMRENSSCKCAHTLQANLDYRGSDDAMHYIHNMLIKTEQIICDYVDTIKLSCWDRLVVTHKRLILETLLVFAINQKRCMTRTLGVIICL